jgi:hypothetical protein
MPTLDTLQTPTSSDPVARIEWTGERIADLCDGTLSKSYAAMVWNYLAGWMDLATEDERRQYAALALRVQDLAL